MNLKTKYIMTIKDIILATILLFTLGISAQNALPEFNDKPAFYDSGVNKLIELEKSQYNIMTKAKGLFKGEGGFFLNGISSSVLIDQQKELKFVVKVNPGTDPTSIFDLVAFEIRNDQRVFITTRANALSTTSFFEKITFGVEKIKEGYYYLTVTDLKKGEYFFGASDFMYAFGVQ